jgi:7-keto-8-aminopelargonate synthetase-like enzyme
MATFDELLQATDEVLTDGARRGAMHSVAEDDRLDGRTVTVDGRRLLNFGSCSYLGLETHPALAAAVADAASRFGSQFSSSRAYLSAPAYAEAEELLAELFGRPAMITTSTSLTHIATLPTLVAPGDALILDHQVHQSVQTAATIAQAHGSTVTLIPHNDMATLDRRVTELARTHRHVWYAADGLYSMYADYAPMGVLNDLAQRHEQLRFYIDDAHAVSWSGRHGRGYALSRLSPAAAARSVVVGSLNKSFAAAGGVATFPDEETRRRVFTVGGPMVFSGPVQPPMLGAIIASARLHFTAEVARRQEHLGELIRLFNKLAANEGLPLVSPSEAPIRCVGAGVPRIAYALTRRLRQAGYFVDTAVYPGVPAKRCGARIALTAHHTIADVTGLVEALADALPRALADEDSDVRTLERAFARQLDGRPVRLRPLSTMDESSGLRLERHDSISTVDTSEWDTAFAGRGAFMSSGLRAIEAAFRVPGEPEHAWRFHYWIVRAADGRVAAATFFTTNLWKDDMLSPVDVSAEVERARQDDPYHLTSTMVAMGCLVTEGNHLYLDRTGDWRAALRLILAAAREEEDRAGGSAVVLRDLPDGDDELRDFLIAEGFLRIPIRLTWVRRMDFVSDGEFLAGLTKKARYHQRTRVLNWEPRYDVTVVWGGSAAARALTDTDRAELYRLYRNVHARSLELNVFPLPRRFFDSMLAQPGWELVILRLPEAGTRPVAFAALHVGPDHVQPVLVGLDYRYVASHHAYQQTLWQTIRAAQRHGAGRVLLGMSADLQKSRFGARPVRRWVYVQPTESYQNDVLLRLSERVSTS